MDNLNHKNKISSPKVVLFRALQWYVKNFPHHRGKPRVINLAKRLIRGPWLGELDTGQRMYLDASDRSVEWKIFLGQYETKVANMFTSLIQPGFTVLDVGAHSGYYTLLSSREVGPGGTVHAFEPTPLLFQKLSRNVELNNCRNVTLNRVALSDKVGELPLYLANSTNSGAGSIVRRPETEEHATVVPATTIDSYVNQQGINRVDLIKMDIEGAELYALRGGERTLLEHAPDIVCEFSEPLYPSLGYSSNDLLDYMGAPGYQVFFVDMPYQGYPYVYFSKAPRLPLRRLEETDFGL